MKTIVFYFTGTGNSLSIARQIAKITGADLVSIPSAMKAGKTHIDADSVVIVYPSYIAPLAGLPNIVARFVKMISNICGLTIIGVCSCGGYVSVNALASQKKLRQIIKACGGRLYAEYSLRLPMNNLDYDHIPIPINKNTDDIIRKSKAKIERIADKIKKRKKTGFKAFKNLFLYTMAPVYKLLKPAIIKDLSEKARVPAGSMLGYGDLMALTDRSIEVDDKCTGCGICESVCPANNIKIINGRPEFLHRCEICFACD